MVFLSSSFVLGECSRIFSEFLGFLVSSIGLKKKLVGSWFS